MLDRLVTIRSSSDENKSKEIKFIDALAYPNIVLLGNPGAGKSFLFKEGRKHEECLYCDSVKKFTLYANNDYKDQMVYIDALDESRSTDKNSIDHVIKKALAVSPAGIRLSCRASDWLGDTDLNDLVPLFERTGGYIVVSLKPLTLDESTQILNEESIPDPEEFIRIAQSKGAHSLLTNPQTLIMLTRAVKNDDWPSCKKELYEHRTKDLLWEHNETHTRLRNDTYSEAELYDAAGAVSASMLISGSESISLLQQNVDYPVYTDVPYANHSAVKYVLQSKAFISIEQDLVKPVHRTIAEYLGARWIAKLICNQQLSLKRVMNLIAVDGHPPAELRGLFAWLATLLPEDFGKQCIEHDPFGVLMYGDAASITANSRKHILQCLEILSEDNPWFRASDWSAEQLGAFSQPDMVESFREVLRTSENQHLRSVVLDAIRFGSEMPELYDELIKIFNDESKGYGARIDAVHAIINAVPEKADNVINEIHSLPNSTSSIDVRMHLLSEFYESNFTPDDVLRVIQDYCFKATRHELGAFTSLRWLLPVSCLPAILDLLMTFDFKAVTRNHSDLDISLGHLLSGLISRCLDEGANFSPIQLLTWLTKMEEVGHGGDKKEISAWLKSNPSIVLNMVDIFLSELNELNDICYHWYNFSERIMQSQDQHTIVKYLFAHIKDKTKFDELDQSIYRLALTLCINLQESDLKLFFSLFDFGKLHLDLDSTRGECCERVIPQWRIDQNNRKLEREQEKNEIKKLNREDFAGNIEPIKSGTDIRWLKYLGQVYYARFSNIDNDLAPRERVESMLGTDSFAVVNQGLIASTLQMELPSLADVIELNSSYYHWWLGVLAGFTEKWKNAPDVSLFKKELLEFVIAVDLLHLWDEKNIHEWKDGIFEQAPELVVSTYKKIMASELVAGKACVSGLYELCNNKLLANYKGQAIIELLKACSEAEPQPLSNLLYAGIISAPRQLTELIVEMLDDISNFQEEQCSLWYSVAFVLVFENEEKKLQQYFDKNEQARWKLMDMVKSIRSENSDTEPIIFSVDQLIFLINTIGFHNNNKYPQSGVTCGRNYNLDSAEFVRNQINELASRTEADAVEAMRSILVNDNLGSYHDYIKHASANQITLVRQSNFKQPDWQETVQVLSAGKPESIEDLYAYTIDCLEELKIQVRNSNTDQYKQFWNEDQYSKVTAPKVEETCRDRLIDIIKAYFTCHELSVEPEGHMADDKRADIIILNSEIKLPLELKRDVHDDIWTACENQLDRLYTRDPNASGFGLYVAFWYGEKRVGSITTPLGDNERPTSAEEMEVILNSLIPQKDRNRLQAIVLDVSPPEG